MKTISHGHSVAMIPDDATLMIGGFMSVGTPERFGDELVGQNKRDLTVIANDTVTPDSGISKLVAAKRVRKAIVSGACGSRILVAFRSVGSEGHQGKAVINGRER
jgi:acetate CoA/acetoacetate CoA-transferase alpha subunit